MEKIAYKISELTDVSPFGKTKTYEAINSGALKAHKLGASTIVMHDDLEAWLRSLPEYEPAAQTTA